MEIKSKLDKFSITALCWSLFLCSFIFFFNQAKKLEESYLSIRSDVPNDLYEEYALQNEKYFDYMLPKDTIINWDEYRDVAMGSTRKLLSGRFCISLNKKYCLAHRTAHLTLLHEECHIIAWDEYERGDVHGLMWQSCMVSVERRGANRQILIDNYEGK